MEIRALAVPNAAVLTPQAHADDRGVFLEWYRLDAMSQASGTAMSVAQANCSVSKRGTLRGIHYADVPPGQAKYVTCVSGAVLDVVADVRVGSPTFGQWDSVRLDTNSRAAVFIGEGLGHGFCALTDDATVVYLCSTVFTPEAEHAVHPLDPELGIEWPADIGLLLSEKDEQAPTLQEALASGLLPSYEACQDWYRING